ncbi:copper homeostasis protein CutC [Paraliobacillus ryukyuensis]|uniref:PF03932 family protein CutC n=1 Tax=Paraliobacillus ryukyuensis TaxID=200904 RepID=A0A366E4C4_9BACI|nr:copper homeostasis protein CutC [Paraliobacillus ryukyuensis]RBO97167.1 copper homeostasis protein [Paraliobacillus ryukyuensis]
MKLEVIAQQAEEAKQAEQFGADRLELVSAINEGGLTPSYGTIKQVLQTINIPVQVMIRPHSYHFHYRSADLAIIYEDIKNVISLGGNRIVFGALTEDNKIDRATLETVLKLHSDLDITFHRAFDEVTDLTEAYHTLRNYKQVKRILTAGGASDCLTGKVKLKQLVSLEKETNGPVIMPGSGLSSTNMREIHQAVGASHYHFGKSVRMKQSYAESFDPISFIRIREKVGE